MKPLVQGSGVPDSVFLQVLLGAPIATSLISRLRSSEGRGLVWGLAKADTKRLECAWPRYTYFAGLLGLMGDQGRYLR